MDRRDSRQNGLNRRSGREEREEWQSGRQRRNYEQEEGDSKPRRAVDRERNRWDVRPVKESLENEAEGDKSGRRDIQSRAKFEQPWVRGGKLPEGEPQQGARNEWRRERGADRGDEWDRSRYGKTEQDPEWMDSIEVDEPNQKHTQEDFQRWKERMKAGGTPTEEKGNPIGDDQRPASIKPEPSKPDVLTKPAIMSTPEIDAAMDKFFANFNDKAGDAKATETKAPRKGRFAALFSPPPEEPAKETAPPKVSMEAPEARNSNPQPAGMSDADQAGFQRILQMLGQRSSNITPQDQGQSRPKTPSTTREQQAGQPAQARSPITETLRRSTEPAARDASSQSRSSTGLESLLGPQSPARENGSRPQSTSNNGTELLLRLMQQPSQPMPGLGPQSQPNSGFPGPRQTPGILQMPDVRQRLPKAQNDRPPQSAPLERPPGRDSGRHDQQAPREVLQRRPTNGHASAFFDEPFFNELRQTGQQPPGQMQTSQHRSQVLPIGMQRPPGFDQPPQPPTGWPSHHQQLHQQQGPLSAPPGIPNPQHRNMNMPTQSFPPTQQMLHQMAMGIPLPQQIPTGGQRQRKYTGEGGGGPGFPPGMGPPPGFMANGPPPGFPALGHAGTGAQFDGGSSNMSSRHLMDLYAGGQRNGGRGGGGMPPGYQ